MRLLWVRFAFPFTLLAGAGAWALAQDDTDLLRRLDAKDHATWGPAFEGLAKSDERDVIIVRALRDAEARSRLGPRAAKLLARMAGQFGVRAANPSLRAIVADDSAALDLRKAAAEALGETGSVADVTVLGDAIAVMPAEAAEALAMIGGRSAELALRRGGGEDPPLEVRAALARLGDATQLDALVAELGGPNTQMAGTLLAWTTDREIPAERAAWETFLRRRALAERFADIDNEKAGDAAEETAGKARGDVAVAADLVGILRDEKFPATARDKAALALGLADARSAQADLLWACRDGEIGSVRMYAAGALARVGDLSCAPVLVAMLNHDEDKDRIASRRANQGEFFPVDPCFVRALFRMGCKGPATRLIDVLAGEYRTRLHRDCLRALAEVSGGRDFGYEPDSAKPERQAGVERMRAWWREARSSVDLAPRADDPGWPAFREAVAKGIEGLGEFKFLYQMRAKNLLIDLAEPARPQLEAALAHENEHVRMGAADVLAAAGLRESSGALAARLREEPKPAVRTRLLVALEVCARPWPDGRPAAGVATAEAVREALSDRSIDVRIAAARALGTAGEASADTPRLEAARARPENADPAFRFAAAAAVLRLARRAALPEIVAALRSDDVSQRTEGAKALAAAGFDLRGYDPDLAPDAREEAVRRIEAASSAGSWSVPYKERK